MTPQERDVLMPLLDKLRQTRVTDKDSDADQLIRQTAQAQPDALYILAQTVLMQDYALHAAQDRIHALEQQQQSSGSQSSSGGGFLGGLFGGSRAVQPQSSQQAGPWGSPTPSYGPQVASAVQPQYGQPSFLQSAARTAAGVAGGALLFQGIEGLFGGHGGYGSGMGGGGLLGGGGVPGYGQPEVVENVTNNYYDQPVPDDQVAVQGGDSDDDISDQGNFDSGDDSFNI